MLYPEINKLRDEAGSRYYLVSMAAKRARDLIDGYPKLDSEIKTNKPVSIAAEEIGKSLFTYKAITEAQEETAEIDEAEAAEAYEAETAEEAAAPEEAYSEDEAQAAPISGLEEIPGAYF